MEELKMQPAYKRILLKLSGEVLAGKEGHGINFDTVSDVCKHVKNAPRWAFR